MKTKLIPFTGEMIPEAGSLLAQRHKRNRANLPLLPARFEDSLSGDQSRGSFMAKEIQERIRRFS